MTGYESKKKAAQDKLDSMEREALKLAREPSWTCNECGAQEFTSALSEADFDYLACANCGGNEFHKEALTQPAQEPDEWFEGWRVQDFHDACKKPAQEPVAWLHPVNKTCVTTDPTAYARGIPLYTAPQQRPWVGLTDEERQDIALEVPIDAVFITEAILKEKNNG